MVLRKYKTIEEAMEANRRKTRERYQMKKKESGVLPKKRGRKPFSVEEKELQRQRRNEYSREYYRMRKELIQSK